MQEKLKYAHPGNIRKGISELKLIGPTSSYAYGYIQANLVILDKAHAFDFLSFSMLNPSPCPILEVLDPGNPYPVKSASDSDIRYDLGKYLIFQNNKSKIVQNIKYYWTNSKVTFLIGCLFSMQKHFEESGMIINHLNENKVDPTFITNIPTNSFGIFDGPMIVSMWPIHKNYISKAITISSKLPSVHGKPVHVGDPSLIGIKDIEKPDYGDIIKLKPDEIPVFWGCGITPQLIAQQKNIDMITHHPGNMYITDLKTNEMEII
tara:strand:+ start:5888 stop:6676 length:789 start_codon:yes stop_codon:yes gene_type:complete